MHVKSVNLSWKKGGGAKFKGAISFKCSRCSAASNRSSLTPRLSSSIVSVTLRAAPKWFPCKNCAVSPRRYSRPPLTVIFYILQTLDINFCLFSSPLTFAIRQENPYDGSEHNKKLLVDNSLTSQNAQPRIRSPLQALYRGEAHLSSSALTSTFSAHVFGHPRARARHPKARPQLV